jgi:hypothetical protein
MIMAVGTTPDSSGWSPSRTTDPESYGTAIKVENHRGNVFGERAPIGIVPEVPKPPSPSVGGQVSAARPLGWSTGISDPLRWRQRFTGKTLVVPQTKVNMTGGPVGYSSRSQRLDNGVANLQTDYTPSPADVAAQFVGPRSPLAKEMSLYHA